MKNQSNINKVLEFLKLHHDTFFQAAVFAEQTQHPTPTDTRAYSQIVVSLLCGVQGRSRKKGSDLEDGSDVKGANAWEAIDKPRFNGVIKAGTQSDVSDSMASLDKMPRLFLVLWNKEPEHDRERCRIWCVRPRDDQVFREMCASWYEKRENGEIRSNNFQLHPNIGQNSDKFTNECGNLDYPLLFCAEFVAGEYHLKIYRPEILRTGLCTKAD
ncbi:MAG: MamI family restriction endonuclease [Candidatus Latescibacteria bacterium]|nr:MamI family restriction endonuclease [Candidatus Latescibacterota bacterium]